MSIFDKWAVHDARECRPERVSVSLTTRPTDDERPGGIGCPWQTRFKMATTIETFFWANRAQVESTARTARRVLLHELYGDTLAKLDRAVSAIYNDEPGEAIALLEKLRSELVE